MSFRQVLVRGPGWYVRVLVAGTCKDTTVSLYANVCHGVGPKTC